MIRQESTRNGGIPAGKHPDDGTRSPHGWFAQGNAAGGSWLFNTRNTIGSKLDPAERGMALVLTLWFLSLMLALVALGVTTVKLRIQISQATDRLNRSDALARSGTEAWLAQLRVDALEGDPDHFGENWGWGGRLSPGVPMPARVYMPSFRASPQAGDYGFFRVQQIEDLSGKINLMTTGSDTHPRFQFDEDRAYDTGIHRVRGTSGVYYRNLSEAAAESVIRYAAGRNQNGGDTWWSRGDLLTNEADGTSGSLVAGSRRTWHESSRVTTGLDPPEGGKTINLNTAPYEALRTLPTRADLSEFLTQSEAENLIEARSGEDPELLHAHPQYRIAEQDYRDGDGSPFGDPTEACEVAYVTIPDCEGVFASSSTVHSRGLFRVVVLGVSLDFQGDTRGVTKLETLVDRSGGTLEVLYQRSY